MGYYTHLQGRFCAAFWISIMRSLLWASQRDENTKPRRPTTAFHHLRRREGLIPSIPFWRPCNAHKALPVICLSRKSLRQARSGSLCIFSCVCSACQGFSRNTKAASPAAFMRIAEEEGLIPSIPFWGPAMRIKPSRSFVFLANPSDKLDLAAYVSFHVFVPLVRAFLETQKPPHRRPLCALRRRRDSNPRYLSVCRFSRPVPSTTRPLLRICSRVQK